MANMGRVELATVDVIGVMPRCRDCRWWRAEDDHGWLPREDGRGACALAEGLDGHAVEPLTLAFAEDGESLRAILLTAPDFGCVQWAAKE